MQLTQLRLRNFKIFRDQQFEFRPLTLLTGPNSSGKSTVLNALGAILQTQRPHLFPFSYSLNGKNCSLGSFKNLAYGGGTRKGVGVGLKLKGDKTQIEIEATYRFSPSGQEVLPKTIHYKQGGESLEVRWEGSKVGYQVRLKTSFFQSVGEQRFSHFVAQFLEGLDAFIEKDPSKKAKGQPISEVKRLMSKEVKNLGKWISVKPRSPSNLLNEIKSLQPFGAISTSQLTRAVEDFVRLFSYVGPVRSYPSRYYLHHDEGLAIDPAGEDSMFQLFNWRRQFPKKHQEVIRLMKGLEMISLVDPTGTHGETLQVNVQPWKHKETANVVDVGFGVSQVLPLVVKDVALPPKGTLLVNQPEVHLHPSSQSLLADYFVARLRGRRYIIETHSEYIINRLRLLTAQGKVKRDDVSILYLEPTPRRADPVKVHEITIGANGSLLTAPKSFFKTYYSDTYELAMSGFSD